MKRNYRVYMHRKSIHLLFDNVAKAPKRWIYKLTMCSFFVLNCFGLLSFNTQYISFMLAYKLLASAVSKCELNSCTCINTSGRKENSCDIHSLVPCVITEHRRWQLVMARTNITARLDRQPWWPSSTRVPTAGIPLLECLRSRLGNSRPSGRFRWMISLAAHHLSTVHPSVDLSLGSV